MHDVRIALNIHQLRNVHCAVFTNPPQVVARQVHQHDVLGALFWIGQQFLFQAQIFVRRLAARARPGNRPDGGYALLQAYVHFRRSADQAQRFVASQVGEIEIEHVRGGV